MPHEPVNRAKTARPEVLVGENFASLILWFVFPVSGRFKDESAD